MTATARPAPRRRTKPAPSPTSRSRPALPEPTPAPGVLLPPPRLTLSIDGGRRQVSCDFPAGTPPVAEDISQQQWNRAISTLLLFAPPFHDTAEGEEEGVLTLSLPRCHAGVVVQVGAWKSPYGAVSRYVAALPTA